MTLKQRQTQGSLTTTDTGSAVSIYEYKDRQARTNSGTKESLHDRLPLEYWPEGPSSRQMTLLLQANQCSA